MHTTAPLPTRTMLCCAIMLIPIMSYDCPYAESYIARASTRGMHTHSMPQLVPSGCYCPHKAGYSHDTVPRGDAPSLASFRTCSRCACCECAHRLTSFRTCRHRQLPTAGDGVKQQCSSPSPGQSMRALEPKLRPTTARDANEHSFHGAGEVSSLDGVLDGV